ncbi:MAG: radical SAM protein [Muribaculaceae bacterium]|nr:radical SAM protein [Muribaculaceae bacterium]
MYFSKLPYIIYRDYPNYGYLTDNRNYGYDTKSKSCKKVGDRILSKSGSIFYSILTEHPQSLLQISRRLLRLFPKASLEEIQEDAKTFYSDLSYDGFIKVSKEPDRIQEEPIFSYNNLSPYILKKTLTEENPSVFDSKEFTHHRLSRVHLCISERCNEHCVHCYFPESLRNHTMTKDLFLMVLDQCIKNRILNITLSGGEPMLNKNLGFFIQKCRENNFSINVLSNLTLLTDSLIKEFKATPLLSVQTSLYSMDPVIHDSITKVNGSFEKTKQAIKILHSLNIPIQVNCPIIKQNKDNYTQVLDWANSLNIEASSDYLIFGCIDGSSKNLRSRLDLSEIKELLIREKEREGNYLLEKTLFNTNDYICPVCQSSLCISPEGNVYPCEGWQSNILGNVKELPLGIIWAESKHIQKLRNLTLNDFPRCKTCKEKSYCSPCLIRNVNESKNLNYADINPYFCSIAKIKKSICMKDDKFD